MTKDEALKMARTALGVQLDALLGKAGHLRNDDRRRYAENGIKAIDEALAQPEQKPEMVGRITDNIKDMVLRQEVMLYTDKYLPIGTLVYTTPPQRKPLTDEEIKMIFEGNMKHDISDAFGFARAIEAAHGIKGKA